ncbi:Na+/H+ antiporter NhaA [Coraliomargarita parva]|uniref:Na+/H+ antiporter NhaA n=1 Tax=Coraliomargarita parva TaxID=3014050 RepID=UPI0022B5CD63|nr:Na+/H+ antiporter NhaA [Coraliomargarita parva]
MATSNPVHLAVKVISILREFAVFLLLGTFVALAWANLDFAGYEHFIESSLFHAGWLIHEGDGGVSLHFLFNDVFMVLFFGVAMKEVSESFLPGGALSSVRKLAMPALATAGGVLGPILIFFVLHSLLRPEPSFSGGWAIPTATDIAYSWLAAGMIFGRRHPAVTFLLVLAVLDDLVGMIIIATVYTPDVHLAWLGLVVLAVVLCEWMRQKGVTSFWPYILLGGPLSWFGLHFTGVHAALSLVPVIPFLPHGERDAGLFEEIRGNGGDPRDTMTRFEHFFKPIVDLGLFGFGLTNAGVLLNGEAFSGKATWIILLSLLIGKTLGIFGFAAVGRGLGLELPEGLRLRQMLALGMIAGIGFTVALFVTTVYVGTGTNPEVHHIAGQLKLGALLSFSAAPLAFLMGKLLGVERRL